MPILTKEVEIRINPKNVKHYNSLGYDIPVKYSLRSNGYIYDFSKSITVKTKDLLRGSKAEVVVQCDYCGEEKTIHYRNYLDSIEKYGLYSCNKCLHYKSEKTSLMKYGTAHYSTTLECKEKIKNTCIMYYGVSSPSKNEIIKEKTRNTNLEKYGVPHTMQSPEIRAKANETLCSNGTQKTSKQQLYLHLLYGGILNHPISYYAVDICFPEEKLAIEYDGGFHNGRVVLGRLTQEEFDNKELIRDKTIKSKGYKIITIKSQSDKLPSDQILLQMLEQTRQYFSQYPNHSWIEFNIDTSSLRSAEYKDGISYDFGELRTIKDSDLNTKETTLEVV